MEGWRDGGIERERELLVLFLSSVRWMLCLYKATYFFYVVPFNISDSISNSIPFMCLSIWIFSLCSMFNACVSFIVSSTHRLVRSINALSLFYPVVYSNQGDTEICWVQCFPNQWMFLAFHLFFSSVKTSKSISISDTVNVQSCGKLSTELFPFCILWKISIQFIEHWLWLNDWLTGQRRQWDGDIISVVKLLIFNVSSHEIQFWRTDVAYWYNHNLAKYRISNRIPIGIWIWIRRFINYIVCLLGKFIWIMYGIWPIDAAFNFP